MSSTSVPVIKFLFKSEWKVLSEALQLNPIYESQSFENASDLSGHLAQNSAGMIVTSLRDKNDLIQLATLMKMVKKLSPNTLVKVMVVNFSGDKQYEKAVAKLGIMDLVEERIATKALRFKIDFMMKSINVHIKKAANAPTTNAVKSLEQNKGPEVASADLSKPQWNQPLDNENDVWLLKADQDCKKILTRWLIKLMGPSPYVAQWTDTATPGVWKFEFKGESNDFISGSGAWYFRGDQKPDFIWAENLWSFTGNAFELFYKEGTAIAHRVMLKDKQLLISKNSDYAKTKESIIIESFDKDLVFKKELGAAGGAEAFDKEQEKYKNLEGKGKTDSLKGGPLSGKGKTSQINTDPLSMDLAPGDNDLSSDQLAQKNSTDKKSSFWKGKNEYEEAKAGELSQPTDQNINSGSQLSMENKHNKEKTFYKNHNEAEKFEGKEDGFGIKKDGVADNLKGKTSTDEIEGHLTSPDAAKGFREKEAKDMSGKTSTDDLGGPLSSPDERKALAEKAKKDMSGKSSTDDLGGPLASPEERKAFAEKAGKAMSGKSSTDDLGGPLASPEERKAFAEKAKKDMAGKSSTDDLGGPLASKERKNQTDHAGSDELSGKSSTDKLKSRLENPTEAVEPIQRKNKHPESKFISNDEYADENISEDKVVDINSARKQIQKPEKKEASFADMIAEQALPTDIEDATQTAVVTSSLVQGLLKVDCHLDDHFDETIIFSTSQKGLVAEKDVVLNLNFDYMSKKTNLKLTGNITQIDADDEGQHYVTVEVSEANVKAFNSFMKLYGSRQENINLFLKTVKGY